MLETLRKSTRWSNLWRGPHWRHRHGTNHDQTLADSANVRDRIAIGAHSQSFKICYDSFFLELVVWVGNYGTYIFLYWLGLQSVADLWWEEIWIRKTNLTPTVATWVPNSSHELGFSDDLRRILKAWWTQILLVAQWIVSWCCYFEIQIIHDEQSVLTYGRILYPR